jgi:hypothetical protein
MRSKRKDFTDNLKENNVSRRPKKTSIKLINIEKTAQSDHFEAESNFLLNMNDNRLNMKVLY